MTERFLIVFVFILALGAPPAWSEEGCQEILQNKAYQSHIMEGVSFTNEGRYDEAAASFEEAQKLCASDPMVSYALARVHHLSGECTAAAVLYKLALSQYDQAERDKAFPVSMERSRIELRLTEAEQGCQKASDNAGVPKPENDAQRALLARFNTLDSKFVSFENRVAISNEKAKGLSLNDFSKTLKHNLEEYSREVQELTRAYAELVSQSDVPSLQTAALVRVGDIWWTFSQFLVNSPLPPELAGNLDMEDAYRAQLENVAIPIQDKGIEAYNKAMEHAREHSVSDNLYLQRAVLRTKGK